MPKKIRSNKGAQPQYIQKEEIETNTRNVLYTSSEVCKMCKGTILFIQGQDSKSCPGCGSIVENTK